MSDDRTDNLPDTVADIPVARALAKLEADERGVLAIIPRDLEEATRFASGLIKAGIVPDAFKEGGKRDGAINASLVLMGVLKSMEVGLPPITGIGGLLPINNRFAIWGDAAVALVQSKGLVTDQNKRNVGASFDPSTELADWPDDYGTIVSYWRRNQTSPYVGEFTVRDAKRAGLWLNSYRKPWIQYPARMLYNRARAFALRDGFADALMGLGIAEEERDRLPDVEDGGTLKPAGIPSYLSDEAVTADDPPASTRDMQADGPITGLTPADTIQRQQARDLGTDEDRQGDF